MTDTETLKIAPTNWFSLPGDHPVCVHLHKRKLVKGYRHYGVNQWSMILTAEAQILRRSLFSN